MSTIIGAFRSASGTYKVTVYNDDGEKIDKYYIRPTYGNRKEDNGGFYELVLRGYSRRSFREGDFDEASYYDEDTGLAVNICGDTLDQYKFKSRTGGKFDLDKFIDVLHHDTDNLVELFPSGGEIEWGDCRIEEDCEGCYHEFCGGGNYLTVSDALLPSTRTKSARDTGV